MTRVDNADMLIQPKSHTQLVTTLALLKAFKLIELLAIVNNLLAIVLIALSFSWTLKLLGAIVFSVGVLVMYFAIRIRVDVNLFAHWDSLDITELDEVLTMLNPAHQAGRTLTLRMLGSYRLFRRGAVMFAGQSIMLIFLVYFGDLNLSMLHH